jgi:GntR family transcriptional regulator, transcriptional repressor for pyruvate dehydrogenase complex
VVSKRVPKASDVLADQLRAQILGEGLRPGDRLPSELQLIEESKFSRSTVREALRLLETQGLIEIRRGSKGGISVAHPDVTQLGTSLALLLTLSQAPLRQLIEFRKVVEPDAAAKAAVRISDGDREELIESIAGMGIAEFHGQIGIWSGNEMYRVVLAAVHSLVSRHVGEDDLTDDELNATWDVHRRIAQAIADRNPDLASRLMFRHLETFEEVLESQERLDKPIVSRRAWKSESVFEERIS